MIGEALGFAAFGGNDVDVRVAVVKGGEGDQFAVGRKFRIELVARTGREAVCGAALSRRSPEVAGV
jgi:hypothetical protein